MQQRTSSGVHATPHMQQQCNPQQEERTTYIHFMAFWTFSGITRVSQYQFLGVGRKNFRK